MDICQNFMTLEFKYNAVFVVESLREGDIKSGNELYEDGLCWEVMKSPCLGIGYRKVLSRQEFDDFFVDVMNIVKDGVYPILHFEMHGDENGVMLADGSFVQYSEFRDSLREINILMKNNLVVSMASCRGAYIFKSYKLEEPSVMFAFLGFLNNFDFCFSLKFFRNFYAELFRCSSMNKVIEEVSRDSKCKDFGFVIDTCVSLFMRGYCCYAGRFYGSQKAIYERSEAVRNNLISEGLQTLPAGNAIRKIMLDKERWFIDCRDRFFMIDKYNENANRFKLSYEDMVSYCDSLDREK